MCANSKDKLIKSLIDQEFKPEIVPVEKVNLSLFNRISVADIAVLGAAFVPLIESLNNFSSTFFASNAKQNVVRGTMTYPVGTHLQKKVNGEGYVSMARDNKTNYLVSNGAFHPEERKVVAQINPYMIAIAAMLISINAKLNDIQKTQDYIITFLEQKERAKLEGDLTFLSDIINNYKLNWNNEKYTSANHVKVLDIKQFSEQSIQLFKQQAKEVIDDSSLFHTTKKINKTVNRLMDKFYNYRLAVYMYAFSSYVDVLLLENFDSEFLNKISSKIADYALEYREVYTDVYATLERYSKKSLRSIASRGTADATKFLGRTVEKIPKLSDTQIDETLIAASEKIKNFDITENDRVAKLLVENQKVDVSVFTNHIKEIDFICNHPLTVLVGKDTIYIENEN